MYLSKSSRAISIIFNEHILPFNFIIILSNIVNFFAYKELLKKITDYVHFRIWVLIPDRLILEPDPNPEITVTH